MIETHPIINITKKIFLIFDSDSLIPEIDTDNEYIKHVIKYNSVEGISSIRIDCETNDVSFSEIKTVKEFYEVDGSREIYFLNSTPKIGDEGIVVEKDKILQKAKKFLNIDEYSHELIRQIGPFFFHQHPKLANNNIILITANKELLKRRKKRKIKEPDFYLTIFDPKEASIFLSLYFKERNLYYISPGLKASQNLWYEMYTCLKIPHLHFGKNNEVIFGLSKKFNYALIAVDKIGTQNYKLANLVAQDETMCHFYHLLALLAGIFDNLGLNLVYLYNITNLPKEQISLRKNSYLIQRLNNMPQNEFKEYNNILNNYGLFINIVYSIRDIIVHRSGLDMVTISEGDIAQITWKNFIKIDDSLPNLRSKIINYIKMSNLNNQDNISKWGIIQSPSKNGEFLEPFTFSVRIINETAKICDLFMEQFHKMHPDIPLNSNRLKGYDIFKNNYLGH